MNTGHRPFFTHRLPQSVRLLLCLGLLAGCAMGPEFKPPAPPQVSGYTATPLPARTASAPGNLGGSQRFVEGGTVPAAWWREIGPARLETLIEQALQSSPTLEAAMATLRQAQQAHESQAGSTLYPQATGRLGAQRQSTNSAASGQSGGERTFSLYNTGVGVSYNLDLFGSSRRALEALAAQADFQRYQFEGARLTLAANVVTTVILQAQLAAQIRATGAIAATQAEQLELIDRRVALGAASRNDVLALQIQLDQTRAGLPPLRNRLAQANHLLAVLAGRPPGSGALPQFNLEEFTLPAELPLYVPSELARRRPDIQASEALLRAANAQHGAAVARQYPRLTLSADLGWQALTTAGLFGAGSMVWGLAGQLSQPLFNQGLPAEARAAAAGFDAAAANYRQTVLQALRNVADVLHALENDAQTLSALAAADRSAQESLQLMRKQHALGQASYLQLLIAGQQAEQTALGLIAAKAQRLADTVALYQSMGGGWPRDEPAPGAPARDPAMHQNH